MNYELISLFIGVAVLIHFFLAFSVSRALLSDLTLTLPFAWSMIVIAWLVPYIGPVLIQKQVINPTSFSSSGSSSGYTTDGGTPIGGGDSGGCGGD